MKKRRSIVLREMEYWPSYTTPNEKPYTLKHAQILETTLGLCSSFRTAVQAGGSIGYWPRGMAEVFARVITFEPERLIRECLIKNLAAYQNVEVRPEALGEKRGRCSIERRGFGSHRLVDGDGVEVITLDSLELGDLDLLQLDIEGGEAAALRGGIETIRRCRPLIQVEILDLVSHHEIFNFMHGARYGLRLTIGRDFVFAPR